MRRFLYGIALTLLWCVCYMFLDKGIDLGIILVFLSGASTSLLWDVGVSSCIKERDAIQRKGEGGKNELE